MLRKVCFLLVCLAVLSAVWVPAVDGDSPGHVQEKVLLPSEPGGPEAIVRAKERLLTGQGALARPTGTAWSWQDTLDDSLGASTIRDATITDGDVVLTQVVPKARLSGQVLSMTKCNGKIYLGMAGARLMRYDPTSGAVDDLGTPVPQECET